MPAHTIKCPECRTPLKSSKPIPTGKLLTCPKCDVLFAAPEPILDVEVVEDVEVIEDVEVVDDDAPVRRPVRKPAAAAQPARVNAGIEVVEDDEDDQPRPKGKKKGALKPKRKSGGGGKAVIIAVAAVLGLAVLGGGAWLLMWLLSGGGDEPLAYVPSDSQLVIGIDGQALFNSSFGQTIQDLVNGPAGGPISKYARETNAQARDLFQTLVVGVQLQGGNSKGTAVIKGTADWDAARLAAAFGPATKQSVGGYTAYKVSNGPNTLTVSAPNKKVAVLSSIPDDQLARVFKAGGKKSALAGDMATLADKFGSSTAWLVMDAAAQGQLMAAASAMMPANAAAQNAGAELQSVKAFGLALNLTGGQVDVRIGALCADEAAAQKMTAKMQADGPQMTTMLSGFALFKPALRPLATELKDSLKFTTDGALAVMSAQLNVSSLQAAAGELGGLAATAGPPGGMQPRGQPEQPGDNPRGGGGGRGRGGRGKGKGGGG